MLKRLHGIALGVAVKFILENFVYTFVGKYFLKMKGAPTGNRISMCLATLEMQEWRDTFKKILDRSRIEEILAALYVDDKRDYSELEALYAYEFKSS